MSPDDVEPQTVALWTAEIDPRAREVAEGKVHLVDADEVHAEAALQLRALSGWKRSRVSAGSRSR